MKHFPINISEPLFPVAKEVSKQQIKEFVEYLDNECYRIVNEIYSTNISSNKSLNSKDFWPPFSNT